MGKLQFGQTAFLDNDEKYTCIANIEKDDKDYVFLISLKKPPVIKVARQDLENGNLFLTIIKDENKKNELLRIYKEKYGKNITGRVE